MNWLDRIFDFFWYMKQDRLDTLLRISIVLFVLSFLTFLVAIVVKLGW